MAEGKQSKIPGYKAVALLGKGSQGVVYKGIEESTGRQVAIKVLSPKMAKIPEYKARFMREARAALSLSHPNIVKGLDSGEINGLLYYVMEFASGKNLNAKVEEEGSLGWKSVVDIGIQLAGALCHAHGNGLIHRDIKPGNIIVAPDGTAKILDMGLAKEDSGGGNLTLQGSIFGTANYISPEAVHDSKSVDFRSDIYSLGATLYKAAAGRPPFEGINPVVIMGKVCAEAPAPPRSLNPLVPEALERAIMKCLEKKPSDRYQAAAELEEDLKRLARKESPQVVAQKSGPKSRPAASPSDARPPAAAPHARRSPKSPEKPRGLLAMIMGLFRK